MNTLPIIFRAERSGDFKGSVTAVFPTLPADYAGREMVCYVHVGQHSGCSWIWYRRTRPAKPEEYADLLAELKRIYEDDEDEPVRLKVYRRMTDDHRKAFRNELSKVNRMVSA